MGSHPSYLSYFFSCLAVVTSTKKLAIFSSVGEKYCFGPGLLPCSTFPEIQSYNVVFGMLNNCEARSTLILSSFTALIADSITSSVHYFRF